MAGYNKAEAMKVGEEIADTVLGVLNGIQLPEESANVMELISALMAGGDDIAMDKDAAGFHIAAGFMAKMGDNRVDPPAPVA